MVTPAATRNVIYCDSWPLGRFILASRSVTRRDAPNPAVTHPVIVPDVDRSAKSGSGGADSNHITKGE
jgi:hypothetical protein